MLAQYQAAWHSFTVSQRRESSLIYLIKRVELAVRRRLDVVVEQVGITAVQYAALTSLERQPEMTAAALARHSFVTAQTTAQLVRGLEDRGLIERHPDPRSKRQVLLALTPDGEALLAELQEPVAAIEQMMISDLGEPMLTEVRSALESLRATMEPDTSKAEPAVTAP
jgi:DNA-binding MarR family transcriptional regulator